MNRFERCSDVVFAFGSRIVMRVAGSSMEPYLRHGDDVLARPVGSLVLGNCYFYRRNGQIVVHRLVTTDGLDAVLAGDNCLYYEKISCSDIFAQLDDGRGRLYIQVMRRINFLFLFCTGIFRRRNSAAIMRLRLLVVRFVNRWYSSAGSTSLPVN